MTPPPSNPLDEQLMREAMSLAAIARGRAEPNPMVGCIIHHDGRVIGRGYHHAFGQPHAEPTSLANCIESPRGATAVVTLEPCCHTNKKTPPCVPALITAGIRRVVLGQIDPNPSVSGQGIAQLRAAGITVDTGVLEAECRQLNAPFVALMTHHRPYVTLKWAQTADGYLAVPDRRPLRISGPGSTRLVHHLRTRCDAILVSADTVLSDDPSLTARDVPLLRTPLRCILDTHLRTPLSSRLVTTAAIIPTHLFHGADPALQSRAGQLTAAGVHLHPLPLLDGHVDFAALLHHLGQLRLTHLLVEPGERLAGALLNANLWDRLWIIRSPRTLRDLCGSNPTNTTPRAPAIPLAPTSMRDLEPDTLCEYLNPASPTFAAPIASTDLLLPL